jgi:hypothetical protein
MQLRDRSTLPRRDHRRCGDLARLSLSVVVAGVVFCPESGQAQPVASAVDPTAIDPDSRPLRGEPIVVPTPAPAREPTAADVAGAPVPGQESGRLDKGDGGDSPPRLIGRGFLFLPKVAVQAAFAPVRGAIWLNERYRVRERAHGVMFNEPGTMGFYPTVGLQSGFGFTVGARFVHRDLLGAHERLSASAAMGGRFHQAFELGLRSGDRFGQRLRLELKGEADRRPKEQFFGIGNGDERSAPVSDPAEVPAGWMPIDALNDSTAVEARYRQQLLRATGVADVGIVSDLRLRAAGALTDFEVGRTEDRTPIDELYAPESLVGFDGARHAYAELELRWDGRRAVSSWEPRPVTSGGWFAGIYGGRVTRLDEGADFWRYGGEVQHFLRVGRGPRVIAARLHADGVTGSREEVPFFDLPQLGGNKFLRGYATERFRDRIAAVASLDYQWDLSQLFSARVFTDVGRVYESADALTLSGLRMGYGVGLDAHTRQSFWLRTSLASSIDGGIFLNLSFEPVFDVDSRVEKR